MLRKDGGSSPRPLQAPLVWEKRCPSILLRPEDSGGPPCQLPPCWTRLTPSRGEISRFNLASKVPLRVRQNQFLQLTFTLVWYSPSQGGPSTLPRVYGLIGDQQTFREGRNSLTPLFHCKMQRLIGLH